jgi:prophage regulatory protein
MINFSSEVRRGGVRTVELRMRRYNKFFICPRPILRPGTPERVFDRHRLQHDEGTNVLRASPQIGAATARMESSMRKAEDPAAVGPMQSKYVERPASSDPLPKLLASSSMPFRRTIRRAELHKIVPLSATTIYDMERRGEFPRRFNLTARCVVWDLAEVEAWITTRRGLSDAFQLKRAPSPDVRQRKRRPVKAMLAS